MRRRCRASSRSIMHGSRRSASLRRVIVLRVPIRLSAVPARGSQEAGRRSRGVEFAPDSPLEGAGFEPSVPLEVLTVGIVPCRLRGPFHASLPKTKFAADSAQEGAGFEPSVPLEGTHRLGIVPCRLRGPFHPSFIEKRSSSRRSAGGAPLWFWGRKPLEQNPF
jgi:hypothetical protein